jgi:hypothetical protein
VVCGLLKMGRGTNGSCVVCMGDRVETRFVVVLDKTNGQWERQSSMGHDKLRDMECLVPMRKEA